ncbi:MAG: PQQ-binding-like beta-propeller repeat protein, partial [Proteobacteria bacterium]|nr:PQQ-binding-like beta-propeller repeat protein [Pseudomonadota bacterium]
MDQGAQFADHSFIEIDTGNKDTVFEILKGYINNGWPILFSSRPGLKYYNAFDNSTNFLSGGHSMVMTGYEDAVGSRKIFLNSGWEQGYERIWVDYDDLCLDLSISNPKQIWITCVVPGGVPGQDEPLQLYSGSWPMRGHDAAHTGQSEYIEKAFGTLKWRYKTGNYIDSSPAIGSDGTVYVGSWDNSLYALNPDGTLK